MKEEFSDVAMRDRWRRIARRLRGSSVLDIGCSYGDGADFVPEGMSYEGIDIDKSGGRLPKEVWPRRAALSRRRLPTIRSRSALGHYRGLGGLGTLRGRQRVGAAAQSLL